MHLLGAVALAVLYFIARAQLRLHPIRLILLCTPIAIDLLIGAPYIVDKTF